ncbi:MAG: acyl-CoA reductase [Bacteroidota bacterium]
MNRNNRIDAFAKLGEFLGQFKISGNQKKDLAINAKYFDEFESQINKAVHYNGWFTKDNVLFAFEEWSNLLTVEKLTYWMEKYPYSVKEPKIVGLIMAGNIPLVGFHDFLTVLMSGHKVKAKLSSNDKQFFPMIAALLKDENPDFVDKIEFTNDKLEGFDAVVATGSNNTARYFNHYFKDYPSIIRQNRNSVAVLSGDESEEELKALGEDIFRYFGLGCRSVSKLFVPKGYDFDKIFKSIYSYKDIINHAKYANNYDYNKAVYLMSKFKLVENGFFMLKEEVGYGSPIATLFYEYYDSIEMLKNRLLLDEEMIQCVVGNSNSVEGEVAFGQSQHPALYEYADGVDTMDFLLKL